MGAWGVGLYSSDLALDLRTTIGAISRLPFEPVELLRLLCESEPGASGAPENADHTVFWLTAADQFAKRGLDCPEARERALAIISGGQDLKAMARLGMDAPSLRKRSAMLAELGARLQAPLPVKPRKC